MEVLAKHVVGSHEIKQRKQIKGADVGLLTPRLNCETVVSIVRTSCGGRQIEFADRHLERKLQIKQSHSH